MSFYTRMSPRNEATYPLVPRKIPFAVLLILLLAAGCNFPNGDLSNQEDLVATGIAGTLEAQTTATVASAPLVQLPHSVYFLSGRSGSLQVWRLAADGTTLTQITDEAGDVNDFDVSRAGGSVAFETNNQLYMIDGDGSNRRLLVDNAAANTQAADYFYTQRISSPRFSSDSRFLAYAYNGLWILDLATNEAIHLLENQIQIDEEVVTPEIYYSPVEWAPNSLQLLLAVGGSESSTLAFLNPGAEPLVTEVHSRAGIVCCQATWTPDSGSVLVASPYIGLIEPGLWRYDALTGDETVLITVEEDGLFQFAGWPLQLANGSVNYFYASAAEIPDGDTPLFMVSSAADGSTGRQQLRSDVFSNIGEALWAEDGSLALVVQLNPSGGPSGSVVLAYSDGRQLQSLLDDAQQLRWGP